MKKFLKSKIAKVTAVATLIMVTGIQAFADVATPTSMLDGEVTTIIQDFAADIVPTVLALIAILVPVGLTLWAIGFAIKKGLSFLQRKASKSL